jgi:hypothetical protein
MARYVYGLDAAETTDYFGIAVHDLNMSEYETVRGQKVPKAYRLPKLVTLRAFYNYRYPEVERILLHDLFRRFPPAYLVYDYSNEKSFGERLVERFGKERVELLTFSSAVKLQLKKDGTTILQMGYKFPRVDNLPYSAKGQPPQMSIRWLVEELIKQLHNEQMFPTKSGNKLTFDHPPGRHNDLAIAWELSVHGCLKFIDRQSKSRPMSATKVYSREPTSDMTYLTEFDGNKHVRLTSVDVYQPPNSNV